MQYIIAPFSNNNSDALSKALSWVCTASSHMLCFVGVKCSHVQYFTVVKYYSNYAGSNAIAGFRVRVADQRYSVAYVKDA